MSPDPARSTLTSIADPHAFRDHDVPFHTDQDTVPDQVVADVAEMDDLAPTGVTAPDGSVLLMRIEEDCAWKIPSSAVAPGEAYGEAARDWVTENSGLDVTLDGVVGVWRIELTGESSGETAERHFVTFRATPATDDPRPQVPTDALPPERRPADVGWFETLPDGAEEPPGTDHFIA